jgi:hypothetical protein
MAVLNDTFHPVGHLRVVTNQGRYRDTSVYPTTEEGWADRYDRLWCAYLGEPYDQSEITAWHLFRALDTNGNEIDVTKRTFDLVRFIVDTDVGGLLGGKVVLETPKDNPGAKALLPEGEAVWKRSGVGVQIERWGKGTAALGDYYIEAVRMKGTKPYRTTLCGYDPRNVTPIYDGETGTRLVGAIVQTQYQDPPTVRGDGTVEEGAIHTYRRELDETEIRVFRDNKPVPEESGKHGLGVPPIVHVQWAPWTEPDHGLPASVGLDAAVMRLDSLITQFGAVANRDGNPILVLKGAKVGDATDMKQFGRIVSGVPIDGDLFYAEAAGTGMTQMLAGIVAILDHIEKTAPEFLFASEGATSGEARSYKAAAFENKIGNARMRFFGALCTVTAYAVLLDRDAAYDPDVELFCIDAPPILPRNVRAELEGIYTYAKDDIKKADRVRHLQRLGLVDPTMDPDAYAAESDDEQAARASLFFVEDEGPEGGKPGMPPKPGKMPTE